MTDMCWAVVDTNSLLHYRRLNEIDLPKILGVREVRVVVCAAVIRELLKQFVPELFPSAAQVDSASLVSGLPVLVRLPPPSARVPAPTSRTRRFATLTVLSNATPRPPIGCPICKGCEPSSRNTHQVSKNVGPMARCACGHCRANTMPSIGLGVGRVALRSWLDRMF